MLRSGSFPVRPRGTLAARRGPASRRLGTRDRPFRAARRGFFRRASERSTLLRTAARVRRIALSAAPGDFAAVAQSCGHPAGQPGDSPSGSSPHGSRAPCHRERHPGVGDLPHEPRPVATRPCRRRPAWTPPPTASNDAMMVVVRAPEQGRRTPTATFGRGDTLRSRELPAEVLPIRPGRRPPAWRRPRYLAPAPASRRAAPSDAPRGIRAVPDTASGSGLHRHRAPFRRVPPAPVETRPVVLEAGRAVVVELDRVDPTA